MAEQTPVQIFRRQARQKQYRSGTFFLKLAVLLLFILMPFLFPSFKSLDLALKIMIFAVLVASFDILLGIREFCLSAMSCFSVLVLTVLPC
jgi:branched-chain amino acid transport system permease protein